MNVIWEPILAIILAITNFSIKPNPKAPDADAVLAYTVDDADVVLHVDVKSTLGDNYQIWKTLADDAQIKQVPELANALRDATTQAEGGRAMVTNMAGFDPVTDIGSFTTFAKLPAGGGDPEVLFVVRGALPSDLPTKIARGIGGREETIDGRVAAAMPDGTLIGFAKGGALLAGKRAWVEPRIADSWKAPARTRGSAWAHIATALDKQPFFLVASKPSATAAAFIGSQIPTTSFGKDLIANHTLAIVAASSTGLHWTYQAKDVAFAARIKTASEGLIELLRAGHIVPRGVAALVVAALPSYAGLSPAIDGAIKHKDKLMAAVGDLTGDGKFGATVKLTGSLVTVETKARRISDVVPTGMLMGFGAIGFLVATESKAAVSATASGSAKPMTVKPVKPTPAKPTPVRPPVKPVAPVKPGGSAPGKTPAPAS